MPDNALDRPLAAALPWLAALVVGALAHVGVVEEIEDRPTGRRAPLIDVDVQVAAPVPAPASPREPGLADATVFTVDGTCTGEIKPQVAPELLFGIRQRGPTRFEIDRHVLDMLVELAADSRVRAIPAVRAGRTSGVKLFGLRKCSPLSLLGLRNGDLLVEINGEPVAGAEATVAAYRRLRPARSLSVDLVRHQEPLTLTYEIED